MNINLKLLSQAIKDLTPMKVSIEGENQISINDTRVTVIGNMAKSSKISTRFESLRGFLSDLLVAKILPTGTDIHSIRMHYNDLEIESKGLQALIAKYHE